VKGCGEKVLRIFLKWKMTSLSIVGRYSGFYVRDSRYFSSTFRASYEQSFKLPFSVSSPPALTA
jgi:predicted nucleic acid-binding Zn ribbon protein